MCVDIHVYMCSCCRLTCGWPFHSLHFQLETLYLSLVVILSLVYMYAFDGFLRVYACIRI